MSNSELKMGSTIVDFEGDGEFAATHMVAHAGHSVNGTSTLTSHVAQSPKRERLHSGALHSTSFLCFDMKSISPSLQFAALIFGVFFFYGLYGIFMEVLFRQPELKSHGWYLTLVQFLLYTIFSRLEMFHSRETRKISFKTYLILALVTLVTMGFSNASLEYLNYPTQVIFKSCKLIPVLIGGIMIQKKAYNSLDFLAAALMCLGLMLFMLADSKISPNFNIAGVLMLLCALIADAVIGNIQEKSMKLFSASNSEVIFYSYGIGSIYLTILLVCTGRLVPGAMAFSSTSPMLSYGGTIVFSITGYLGTQLVLTLVRHFGAFAAVTVTSLRKAFSITLSFLLFSKPFTFQYLVGGIIVLVGIYCNMAAKKDSKFPLNFKKLQVLATYFTRENVSKFVEV